MQSIFIVKETNLDSSCKNDTLLQSDKNDF